MKFTIDVDCTPEEARAFLGLPDVGPLQARLLADIEARMTAAVKSMDPQEMLRTWMPGGLAGGADALAGLQKAFWEQFTAGTGGKK